jgi:hypothetical protein
MLYTAYELDNRPKDNKDCECLYTLHGTPAPYSCDECRAVAK